MTQLADDAIRLLIETLRSQGFTVTAPGERPPASSSEAEAKPREAASSSGDASAPELEAEGADVIRLVPESDSDVEGEIARRRHHLPPTDGAWMMPRPKVLSERALRCRGCNAPMAPVRSGTRQFCDRCKPRR